MRSVPRIRCSLLSTLTILAFSFSIFAQDERMGGAPLIVDEFTELACEELIGRLDNLFLTIEHYPDMIGIAFISVDPAKKYKSVIAERTINNYVNFRKFPPDRIKVIRTNSGDNLYFRFWMLPPDADLPDFGPIDDTLIFPQTSTEAFLLLTEDEFGNCPNGDPRKLFADFLNANLTARGKIVIRERSSENASILSTKIHSELSEKYGISRDRITVTMESRSSKSLPKIEYWYLP